MINNSTIQFNVNYTPFEQKSNNTQTPSSNPSGLVVETQEENSFRIRQRMISAMHAFSSSLRQTNQNQTSNSLAPLIPIPVYAKPLEEEKSDSQTFNWKTGPNSLVQRIEQAIKKGYITAEEANTLAEEYCLAYPLIEMDKTEFFIPISIRHTKFTLSPEALSNLLGERDSAHQISFSLMCKILERLRNVHIAGPGKYEKIILVKDVKEERLVKVVLAKSEDQLYPTVLTMFFISKSQFKNQEGLVSDIKLEQALKQLSTVNLDATSVGKVAIKNLIDGNHNSIATPPKTIKTVKKEVSQKKAQGFHISIVFDPEPSIPSPSSPLVAPPKTFLSSSILKTRKKAGKEIQKTSKTVKPLIINTQPLAESAKSTPQTFIQERKPEIDLIHPLPSQTEDREDNNQHEISTTRQIPTIPQLPKEKKSSCSQQILKIGLIVSMLFVAGRFFQAYQE